MEAVPRQDLKARLLPDLVITEVRVDGDSTAYFKVTNQGTADATGFIRVSATAYIGARPGSLQPVNLVGVENLAMGASKWVKAEGFGPWSEPYYVGKDYAFPLGKATAFTVSVDPPPVTSGLPGTGLGGGGWFGTDKKKCDSSYGCVRELNETNNSFRAEGDSIGRGKPEEPTPTERG